MAVYDYNTLGLKKLLIVDDVTTFGKGVADNFQKKYEELGGTVVLRQGADKDTKDFNSIINSAAVTADPPTASTTAASSPPVAACSSSSSARRA